jgi:hypothetical protein
MRSKGRGLALAVTLAVTCVSTAFASAAGGRPGPVRVGCGNVIGFDSTHQAKEGGRWRLVLGTAYVPVSLQRAVPVSGFRRWRYWIKQGVAVLEGAGPPVEISLPPSWNSKVRLTWGNARPRGTTIVFSRCEFSHPRAQTWLAYAGGFYIDSPRACVPLRIRVGSATASVTVGIGRRC